MKRPLRKETKSADFKTKNCFHYPLLTPTKGNSNKCILIQKESVSRWGSEIINSQESKKYIGKCQRALKIKGQVKEQDGTELKNKKMVGLKPKVLVFTFCLLSLNDKDYQTIS